MQRQDASLMHSSNQVEERRVTDRIDSCLQQMGQTVSQPQDTASGYLTSWLLKELRTGTVPRVR